MIHSVVYSHYFYLIVLLVGIGGLVLADWRLRLVFFANFSAAWRSIGIVTALLLAADVVGIKLGVFFTNPLYVVGWHIGTTNLPIEEVLFLFLLSYVTLVLYQLLSRLRFFTASADHNDEKELKQ